MQPGPFPMILLLCTLLSAQEDAAPPLDERPAGVGEWGWRPADGASAPLNPPAFVWRPQQQARSYQLQVSREPDLDPVAYEARDLPWAAHCPPAALEPGTWHWRVRYLDRNGRASVWSQPRSFGLTPATPHLPLPGREDLLGRIPDAHPRLFLRPEQLPGLRQRLEKDLAPHLSRLEARCQELLRSPPDTTEPPRYPAGVAHRSEAWREIWWGNRTRTIAVLDGAATLAFAWLLTGREECGELSRRLLLAAAGWDPRGSTGYRYNDEAGMPYGYHMARAYTFLYDRLSEAERLQVRAVMTVRGREMYRHLCPGHLWRPYSSHANRAWHFLGEMGIAFHGEIPEAADWVWFAHHVWRCAYPVWSDADGGWHEGSAYWSSYLGRFLWWAGIMRAATELDAFSMPYFQQVGYYPMYLQPPGTRGGGFGDLTARREARHNRRLMSVLATQAQNAHWQWYVEQLGGPELPRGYLGLLQGASPAVASRPPTDLPASRLFAGTGQAVLNWTLLDATENVEVIFKSSPFGSQSHGYEAQNAFLLYAFGQRLLIRSGRRDMYGSRHHREWMWHTRSVNSVTVGGEGQLPHTPRARGAIRAFRTSPGVDLVVGEAGEAYGSRLQRFTRVLVFLKPEALVILDRLEAADPSTFEWWLHAPVELERTGDQEVSLRHGNAACRVDLLAPAGLTLQITDRFDPPPRERVKLQEWHLAASTPEPTPRAEFTTIVWPHRAGQAPAGTATTGREGPVRVVALGLAEGQALVQWRPEGAGPLGHADLRVEAELLVLRLDREGRVVQQLQVP